MVGALGMHAPALADLGGQFGRAWLLAKRRDADMDTLIALGTGAAVLFSVPPTVWPEVMERWGFRCMFGMRPPRG